MKLAALYLTFLLIHPNVTVVWCIILISLQLWKWKWTLKWFCFIDWKLPAFVSIRSEWRNASVCKSFCLRSMKFVDIKNDWKTMSFDAFECFGAMFYSRHQNFDVISWELEEITLSQLLWDTEILIESLYSFFEDEWCSLFHIDYKGFDIPLHVTISLLGFLSGPTMLMKVLHL